MPLSLINKKIIISGGASGIGWSTAKICLSRGAIVYICDIDSKSLKKAQKHPLNKKKLFTTSTCHIRAWSAKRLRRKVGISLRPPGTGFAAGMGGRQRPRTTPAEKSCVVFPVAGGTVVLQPPWSPVVQLPTAGVLSPTPKGAKGLEFNFD